MPDSHFCTLNCTNQTALIPVSRDTPRHVTGRFAPSPTGELHLGSLITAIASYCLAKQAGGQWLVRIEDVDSERCQPIFASHILKDLERLGLYWDGDVRYQSQHLDTYHTLLDSLLRPVSYGCDCSRKSIQQYLANHPNPTNQPNTNSRYPQICYTKQHSREHAIRIVMPNHTMVFFDHLQGIVAGNPQQEHGDMVLRRRQAHNHQGARLGMINYMLAAVVDDALQGVTQIVRGLDILPLTIPQMAIADYLHFPLIASYYHLPVLLNTAGQKLSKQTLAEPIAAYPAPQLIALALRLLGQPAVDINQPATMLQQAISQWDNRPLYRKQQHIVSSIQALLS